MTWLRGVGPRWACDAGSSPVPAYASTSVRRTVTPPADTVQPSSVRAVCAICAAGAESQGYVIAARVVGGRRVIRATPGRAATGIVDSSNML